MTPKNVLVTGATGHQGSALISALLVQTPQQFNVLALTRDANSKSAAELNTKGVTVVQGDTTKPEAILAQIQELYGIFLVTVPNANERDQAIPLINAASAAGVKHFIFTSADRGGPTKSEDENYVTPIPHFEVKRGIEKHLRKVCESGEMKYTILRPTSFIDNLTPGLIGKALATMLKQMGITKLWLIATKDIGRVAAMTFEKPGMYAGQALTLSVDSLSFNEMNAIFREETGGEMPTTWEVLVDGLQWVIADLGASMKYFRECGYGYEIDRNLAGKLGLWDFRTWLRQDSKFEIPARGVEK
jgi:uncharacterized protein YbjT (DUF2867 family)